MADTKISALTSAAALDGTEILAGAQSAATVGITAAQVKTYTSASPTLVTPTIGVATATSVNKLTITAPASSAVLTIANGKTLTCSNTLTLTATDSSTLAIGAGGTLASAAYKATGTSGNTVPLLDGANTFSASQTFSANITVNGQATAPLQTLTDGANVAWNCNSGAKAKVTLTANRTMDAVSNAIEGSTYLIWVIQDGSGSHTLTWTSSGAGSYDFGAVGAPTLTTTASKADLIAFEAISIGGTLKLRFCGIQKGFA